MLSARVRVYSGIASVELLVAALFFSAALLTVISVQLSAQRITELSRQMFFAARQLDELTELVRVSSTEVCAHLALGCVAEEVAGSAIDQEQFAQLLAHWLATGDEHLPAGWLPVSSPEGNLIIHLSGMDAQQLSLHRRIIR